MRTIPTAVVGRCGHSGGVLALVQLLNHHTRGIGRGAATVGRQGTVPPRAVTAVRVEVVRVGRAAGFGVKTGGLEGTDLIQAARAFDQKRQGDVIGEI
jgi:hypothetical protein